MVGRRGETPLVPPYRLRRPNKTMALTIVPGERDSAKLAALKWR